MNILNCYLIIMEITEMIKNANYVLKIEMKYFHLLKD